MRIPASSSCAPRRSIPTSLANSATFDPSVRLQYLKLLLGGFAVGQWRLGGVLVTHWCVKVPRDSGRLLVDVV